MMMNMDCTLNGATSFDQDLCAWGDKFACDSACDFYVSASLKDQAAPFKTLLRNPNKVHFVHRNATDAD
jgi:hypothetical protein